MDKHTLPYSKTTQLHCGSIDRWLTTCHSVFTVPTHVWCQDVHFCYTKVPLNVLISRVLQDGGMPQGIRAIFVNPWVQGGVIDIIDTFPRDSFMITTTQAGTSPKQNLYLRTPVRK